MYFLWSYNQINSCSLTYKKLHLIQYIVQYLVMYIITLKILKYDFLTISLLTLTLKPI